MKNFHKYRLLISGLVITTALSFSQPGLAQVTEGAKAAKILVKAAPKIIKHGAPKVGRFAESAKAQIAAHGGSRWAALKAHVQQQGGVAKTVGHHVVGGLKIAGSVASKVVLGKQGHAHLKQARLNAKAAIASAPGRGMGKMFNAAKAHVQSHGGLVATGKYHVAHAKTILPKIKTHLKKFR